MCESAHTLPHISATVQVAAVPWVRPPLLRRLWEQFAHWHDLVFGPSQDPAKDFYGFLFHRNAGFGSLSLIVLAAALPSNGAGVPVCLFRYLSNLPCPGCGLTRSFSSILHLHFSQAYDYHPFGYVLLPLFGLIALQSFLPLRFGRDMESFVRAQQAPLRQAYMTLIYGFIAFGALRIAVYAIQGLHAQ